MDREYRCLDGLKAPRLIIDCGANVGYSAAYFLSRHPGARVIAVEPESGNFRTLRANVRRFGSRVRTVRAGVWSHRCGLKVERSGYRDGREWAAWVRECRPDEAPDVRATDIQTLLRGSGEERISILKIDIERSELQVFSVNYKFWLSRCDAIVIELHDAECEAVFHQAIEGQNFSVSRCGELTVCIRNG